LIKNQSHLEKYIEFIKEQIRQEEINENVSNVTRFQRVRKGTTRATQIARQVTNKEFNILMLFHCVYPLLPIFTHILHYFLLGYTNTVDYTCPDYNLVLWGSDTLDPLERVFTPENMNRLFGFRMGTTINPMAAQYIIYLETCARLNSLNVDPIQQVYNRVQGQFIFLPKFHERYGEFFQDKVNYLLHSNYFLRRYDPEIHFMNLSEMILPKGIETENILIGFAESFFEFIYQEFQLPGPILGYRDYEVQLGRVVGNQEMSYLQDPYLGYSTPQESLKMHFNTTYNTRLQIQIRNGEREPKPRDVSPRRGERVRIKTPRQITKELEAWNAAHPIPSPETVRAERERYENARTKYLRVAEANDYVRSSSGYFAQYIGPVIDYREIYPRPYPQRDLNWSGFYFEQYCRKIGQDTYNAIKQQQPNLPDSFIPIDVIDRFLYLQTYSAEDPPIKQQLYDYITTLMYTKFTKDRLQRDKSRVNMGLDSEIKSRLLYFHVEDDDLYTEIAQNDPNIRGYIHADPTHPNRINW
jgi:hypothetical protein